jgi:DnaJ-domain-containing protein 1
LDPKKVKQAATAQAEQDRATFSKAAREIGLSDNEANFRLVREVLGSGFTSYAVSQAVDSGAVRLAATSPVELEAYRQEYAEHRQDWLVNQASPAELREAANRESEQLRTQAQRQQVAAQIEAREQLDAQQGYPALPTETSDGVKLDGLFFKRLADIDIKKFKQYCTRYGFAAITARLNGVR